MEEFEKYIWYVEASDDDGTKKSGSAVAVWLKPSSKNTGKRYLLTCGHVLRSNASSDNREGYGRVLPTIRVWESGGAYGDEQAKEAHIEKDLDFSLEEIDNDLRDAHAIDWVLLTVDDAAFTENGEALDSWGEPPSSTRLGDEKGIKIFGFPGGVESFHKGVVKPVPLLNYRLTKKSNGLLTLRGGEETKAGMSGGGIFGPDGTLWGIHRSRKEKSGEFVSIAIDHIGRELRNQISLIPAASQSDPRSGSLGLRNRAASVAQRKARKPMQNFLISIESNCDDDWQVSVQVDGKPPGGEAGKPICVDLNSVRGEVAQLFLDWALRGRVNESDKVRQLGKILYTTILNKNFREILQSTIRKGKDKKRLHVSLLIDNDVEPELKHLPWEYLGSFDPRVPGTFNNFASESRIAFSRCINAESAPAAPKDLLRALVLYPSSTSKSETDTEKALLQIVNKLQRYNNAKIQIEFAELCSTTSLAGLLTKNDESYDIVHYVGIGRYLDKKHHLLISEDNFVEVNLFANGLVPCPRLVILEQCHSRNGAMGNRSNVPADFGVLAPAIVDRGIEGVIAFRDPVEADHIERFNERLYTILSEGEPLQIAVQEARMIMDLGYLHRCVSPALFTVGPEELVLCRREDPGY